MEVLVKKYPGGVVHGRPAPLIGEALAVCATRGLRQTHACFFVPKVSIL